MGKIKKLKSNELVGGVDREDVYPITSTKAVFDDSNASQDDINKNRLDRIEELEETMPTTVKSITINGGQRVNTVDENGNVDLTIYSDGGQDYEGLTEVVADLRDIVGENPEEPQSGTLLERVDTLEGTVGAGGSVDQRIENAINDLDSQIVVNYGEVNPHIRGAVQLADGKLTRFELEENNIASASDLQALDEYTHSIYQTKIEAVSTRPATGEAGIIYRVPNSGGTTYTDWMYSNGWKELATFDIASLNASDVNYNNSTSGLAANNVQAGLDEVADNLYSYESIDWINKTTSLSYYISGNTATLGQWAKQNSLANYYCRILPIDNNTIYKITAQDGNPAHVALLRNNTPDEGVVATDWNNGTAKRINAGESMVIDSGNYSYLYFRNNANSTSSDFKNPKRIEIRKSVNEAIEALSEVTDALGVDIEENKKQILDVESKLYPYLDNIPEVNYSFSTNAFGTDASFKHAAIPVSVGEEYIIEAPSGVSAFYCFAKNNTATSGNPIPFIDDMTSAIGISSGKKVKVTIPDTCTYLLVYNASNTRPFLIKKESILKKVRITLGYDYIMATGNTAGDFGQHQSNFESGQFHATPRFIKISESFICKFNQAGRLRVIYYDSEFNFVGFTNYPFSNDSPAIEANTDIFVNENRFKYSYVKLLFDTETPFNNGKPLEVEAEVRSNLDDNWDVFNIRTSIYHRICVMVNVSDARCSDGITVVNPEDTPEEKQVYLQDSIMMKPNYGVITLPPTYSNTGKPTRLIIYCHGSGTHFTFSNSTSFNTSEHVDTKYWRKEGYAVMDIDGNPMSSSSHAFRPQAMSAYIAAYKWAIEHYNLCRDGVLLGGRSMGAGTVMYLLRGTCPIPVIAACANHPTSVAMNETASSKLSIANMRGFIIPDGFTFSDGPMTDEETQVYYDNWDKSIRYVPSLALCVDTPTTEEWRKNFIKNCCHVGNPYEANRIASCKDLHMVVRAPLKMFACTRDPNNSYQATSQLYMTMLGNAGQQAELRLFDSNKTNYSDNRNEHYYELADPNLRTTFTTVYGEEVIDVPIVYIEMLQFWRRYEQNM